MHKLKHWRNQLQISEQKELGTRSFCAPFMRLKQHQGEQNNKYLTGPILEFKGSIRHVQKGHLNLTCFSQTDENLSISDNWFSSCMHTPFLVYFSFYNLSFPLVHFEDFENT